MEGLASTPIDYPDLRLGRARHVAASLKDVSELGVRGALS
jgi:hypothetical protein